MTALELRRRWVEGVAPARAAVVGAAAVLTWWLATVMLPQGAPAEIVLQGLVVGSPTALTALGLILVWRSHRVVNFAAMAIGALGGGIAVKTFLVWEWPYPLAVGAGPLLGAAVGALVEVLVIRRFARSSRLVVGVATIGLTQLLGGLELFAGRSIFGEGGVISGGFPTPLSSTSFNVGVVLFDGNHLLIVAVVPVVVAALGAFLRSSLAGTAVRGAAENEERARLLGIPVRSLQSLVWAAAGALAAVTYVLQAPFTGAINSAATGPTLLLPALAAAVVARMESLPVAFAAALGLGAVDQVVRWNVSRTPQVADLVFLVVILAALLLQRPGTSRARAAESSWDGPVVLRPLPGAVRRLWEVRMLAVTGGVALLVGAVGAPFVLSPSDTATATVMMVWGMVAVSLVVLSGWSGQVSLGQFAFVGVGAMVCGNLLSRWNVDLFVAMAAAAGVAGLVALAQGVPALRIGGPFLAVVTLAFAQVVDGIVLNDKVWPSLVPTDVVRPVLLGRWDLESERVLYLFALGTSAAVVAVARGVRRARSGRLLLAARDNRRAAEASGVRSRRQVLSGFVLSGAIAGVAGAVHVVALHGARFGTYSPVLSVEVFSRSVIGGLGTVAGAVVGAMGLRGLESAVGQELRFVLGGTGLLVILWLLPGGLGQVLGAVRDALVRPLARRHGLELDGATRRAAAPVAATDVAPPAAASEAAVSCRGVDVSYGSLQVLFDVELDLRPGELVALLGTNGAGKSTLLRALCGLAPSSGTFVVHGRDLSRLRAEQRARAGIGLMPGGRSVFPTLTVAENLRLATWSFHRDGDRVRRTTADALEQFPGLRDHLDRLAGDLSGGQQQQLALAQTMMLEPSVLLIDELSLGLAPTVVGQLMEVVRRINGSGVTVLVVEQSVNVALALAERAVFMEKGTVRFSGPTAELAGRPDLLRAVFLEGAGVDDGADAARPGAAAAEAGAFDTIDLTELEGARHPAARRDGRAEVLLECRGVTRRFGGVVAVDGVDLDVVAGEILGLVGQNGAGKTTLLDCISGFLPLDAGVVRLGGVELTDAAPHERARAGLGRSFQEARLFPSLSVAETIAVACERHARATTMVADALRQPASFEAELDTARRVSELVDLLGLRAHAHKLTSELSTGMRRIVELACLLAAEPRVLLLDEPSAGVAQRETEALGPLLVRIRDRTGAALVVIEHDMPLLSSICDRMVALELGRVIAEGPPDEVLDDPRVVAAYLGTDEAAIARSG